MCQNTEKQNCFHVRFIDVACKIEILLKNATNNSFFLLLKGSLDTYVLRHIPFRSLQNTFDQPPHIHALYTHFDTYHQPELLI